MTLQDLQFITIDDDQIINDKSHYGNYSKTLSITVGYLIGVKDEYLQLIDEDEEFYQNLKINLDKNKSALKIRTLNNIRSNLMLLFKDVSRTIRVTSNNYIPLYKMEAFEEDFKMLKKLDVDIITGKSDINEYLSNINTEINRNFDNIISLFPEWVNIKFIRNAFLMPKNIKIESEKFQKNQNCYPYKRYFNWKKPEEKGNILLSDAKFLEVIYEDNGTYFSDCNKVIDASDCVKDNIYDFIQNGNKIQIFIDGENTDPYRFASAIDSLQDYEIQKIEKIVVYYDQLYSSRAWDMLRHFTYDIEVETVPVDRIIEHKSLVDHKLVAGVSKAVYRDGADSIIIASSDSDFWAVIEEVDANFLVMVEKEKCSHDFKEILRDHDVFYCYLDKFQTPVDNKFFKTTLNYELKQQISEQLNSANIKSMLNSAITQSRADISDDERKSMLTNCIKNLKLNIDKDYNVTVILDD